MEKFEDPVPILLRRNFSSESEVTTDGLIVAPMSSENQNLECTLCGGLFVNEEVLNYHLKTHDKHEIVIAREIRPTSNFETCVKQELDIYNRYKCAQCDYEFNDRQTFEDHTCEMFKPFKCDICSATFRYMQGLRLHSKLHQPDYITPEKKHCCEICNKRFCRKQVLLRHKKSHAGNAGETINNKHTCHLCGKSVSSKNYLLVHFRQHTGEKPHICNYCGKGFISQNYLSVHERIHTGEKPYECLHCQKRFSQRTSLVVHLRTHTGDKPYSCSYCGNNFASKTMLNSHLKNHEKESV